jgi:hypothetical protein
VTCARIFRVILTHEDGEQKVPKFRAKVQYDDWEGTAAADVADQRSMETLLEEKGSFNRETEFLAGIEFGLTENHRAVVDQAYVYALIAPKPPGENWGMQMKEEQHPLRVRQVEVDLPIGEFLGLFKRFSVVLTKRGLSLTGRNYEIDE